MIVLMFMLFMSMIMFDAASMTVAMMLAAAQDPGASDVHQQAEACDRNGLGKMNCYRCQKSQHRLIPDQQCDHRQDDGAGKSGELAELAGAKYKALICRVPARIRIDQGSNQHGS